jgi:hypothetical protein
MGQLIQAVNLTSVTPIAVPPGTPQYLALPPKGGRYGRINGPVTLVPAGTVTIQLSATNAANLPYAAGLDTGYSGGLEHQTIGRQSLTAAGGFALTGFVRVPQTVVGWIDAYDSQSLYLLFLDAGGNILQGTAL